MGVGAIDVVAVDVVDATDVPVVDVAALGRTRDSLDDSLDDGGVWLLIARAFSCAT